MSKLPSIPPDKGNNRTLNSLKELAEIWKGERGNKLDRVVTFRDMIKAGIGSLSRGGSLTASDGLIISQTYTTIPVDLTATGGLGAVYLDWSVDTGLSYAHTEIFRNTEDNLAEAVLIGTSVASLYVDDSVASGGDYYYWVRAVSTSGDKTQFNASAGTLATVALEVDYVVGLMEGNIGRSELASEILTPLDKAGSDMELTKDQFTVKINSDTGHIAGIGLMHDGVSSEFVVASDAVYFIDPDSSATAFVKGHEYADIDELRSTDFVFGYANVAGQNRFAINVPAYIEEGVITTAHISNATINMAQINDLNITSAEIGDGEITSAKIGDYIQSNSFSLGNPGGGGWHINKNGSAFFNDVTIYDDNGGVAFHSGTTVIPDLQSINSSTMNMNPDMKMQDVNGNPIGYIGHVPGSNGSRYWNSTKTIVEAYSFGVQNAGISSTAFRVVKGAKYKIRATVIKMTSGTVSTNIGLYHKSGASVSGYRFVAYTDDGNDDIAVQEGYISTGSGVSVTSSSWVTIERYFEVPSDATYDICSAVLYGNTTASILVDDFSIIDVTWEDAGALAKRDTVGSSEVDRNAIATTHIENAAIETLKIDGNAVTVMQGVDFGGKYFFATGVNHLIGSIVFNHGHSENVTVIIDACTLIGVYDDSSASTKFEIKVGLRVEINGVLYATGHTRLGRTSVNGGVLRVDANPSFTKMIELGPGNHTIKAYAYIAEQANVECYVGSNFMTISAGKR